jgi:hypothetical protein
MGRIIHCVLAASALLHPLGAEVNANPLRAELPPDEQFYVSPANFARSALIPVTPLFLLYDWSAEVWLCLEVWWT